MPYWPLMLGYPTPLVDRLDRFAANRPTRLVVLFVASCAVYLQAHFFWLAESHEVDSYSYWFAARAVAAGQDPYDTAALQAAGRLYELRLVPGDTRPPDIYPYVYPPPLAGLWRAMTALTPTAAHRVLEVTGTLMLGAAMLLLHRVVRPARHGGLIFAAFTLALAVNGPAVSSTRLGQMNAPLLVAMLLAVEGYRRGEYVRSAFALAAAMLVKITPGLLLLGWALGDSGPRWRAQAIRIAAAAGGLTLISLPFAPWIHWQEFVTTVARGIPWQAEYSWWGWLTVHGDQVPALLEYRLPLYAAGAALLVACAWRHMRRVAPEDVPVEGAAVATVLALLLSPLTWQHHFLFFLLPAYAWLARTWAEGRWAAALALVVLTTLVLLRLPGAWLIIRPAATLAAFMLVTLTRRAATSPPAASVTT